MEKLAVDDVRSSVGDLTLFESRLLTVLALLLVQEREQTQQISLLSRAGFRPSEIASLIGTTPNTVSVCLSKHKRTRRASRPK